MARYKVLAGAHEQDDKTQKPELVKNTDGSTTEKYPSATYKVGDIFENDTDMVAKHGADKFQLVGGSPEPYTPSMANPAKFPGGQVSSGIQGGEAAEAKRREQEEGSHADMVGDRKLSLQEQADYNKAKAELNKKPYPELVEIAKQQRVDLKGATSKAEVINAILNK